MKIIGTVPFITSKKEFLDKAGEFLVEWSTQQKAGKKFPWSHVLVLGTVKGVEVKTLVFTLAETEADTIESMSQQVLDQMLHIDIHMLRPGDSSTSLTRTMYGKWDEVTKTKVAEFLNMQPSELENMYQTDLALDNLIATIKKSQE